VRESAQISIDNQ